MKLKTAMKNIFRERLEVGMIETKIKNSPKCLRNEMFFVCLRKRERDEHTQVFKKKWQVKERSIKLHFSSSYKPNLNSSVCQNSLLGTSVLLFASVLKRFHFSFDPWNSLKTERPYKKMKTLKEKLKDRASLKSIDNYHPALVARKQPIRLLRVVPLRARVVLVRVRLRVALKSL